MYRNLIRCLGVWCLLLLGAGGLQAADAPEGIRGLQPGPVTPASPPATSVAWVLEMGLANAQVPINQPVQFRVRSNREIHFSVLGIASDGTAQQLVPRPGASPLILAAGALHELPQDYDLRVPTAGTERLYLVASTRPVVAIGVDGKPAVTPTDPAAPAADNAALLVSELLLTVVDPAAAPAAPTSAPPTPAPGTPASPAAPPSASSLPTLVLDAPGRMYRIGESFELQYGASRDGWLHLFLHVGGELKLLGVKAVQAERFQTLRATAIAPAGEQALVALWSATEKLDEAARSTLERRLRIGLAPGSATRALTLVVDVPIAYRSVPLLINP